MRGKSNQESRRAAVLANDDALRESLIFLLQSAGLDAVAFADVESMLGQTALDEDFIFIEDAHAHLLDELRDRGWRGLAVTMTEGLSGRRRASTARPAHVLIKPFIANDVLAILSGDGSSVA